MPGPQRRSAARRFLTAGPVRSTGINCHTTPESQAGEHKWCRTDHHVLRADPNYAGPKELVPDRRGCVPDAGRVSITQCQPGLPFYRVETAAVSGSRGAAGSRLAALTAAGQAPDRRRGPAGHAHRLASASATPSASLRLTSAQTLPPPPPRAGNIQPDVRFWNRLGYGNNAVDVIYVDVHQ